MNEWERDYLHRYDRTVNWLFVGTCVVAAGCLGFWIWLVHKVFPLVLRVTQ